MLGRSQKIYVAANELDQGINKGTSTKKKPTVRDEKLSYLANTISVSRLFILFCIIIATITITSVLYINLSNNELNNFTAIFDSTSSDISNTVLNNMNQKLTASNELASIYANLNNNSYAWPNITYPGFTSVTAALFKVCNCVDISFCPLIDANAREEWETYAMASLSSWKASEGLTASTDVSYWTAPLGIYDISAGGTLTIDHTTSGSLAPIWQIYPYTQNNSLVMWNLLSNAHDAASLGRIISLKSSQFSYSTTAYASGARLLTPILSVSMGNLLGLVAIRFEWSSFFSNDMTPANAASVDAVLTLSTTNSLTFNIAGNTITMKRDANGDYHDTSYDFFHKAVDMTELSLFISSNCSITLYPTAAFVETYITKKPLMYAASIGTTIFFIGLLFLCYDRLLFRRLRTVATVAENAQGVVDELFPASFRDKLYQHNKRRKSMDDINHRGSMEGALQQATSHPHLVDAPSAEADTAPVRPPMLRRGSMQKIAESMQVGQISKSMKRMVPYILLEDGDIEGVENDDLKPIAKLFPHATVLFADIAGFTKWSSARTPVEVFELLEGLFFIFDKAADERGVFKVETIGDCYMAVCGIPDQDVDHASNMADFALDMLEAIPELIRVKGEKFIEGLQIRVGLHSGPVTAGVLRGAKSRFQLFGDTVNTASRMESNGRPSWIHLSSSTARYLDLEGSQHHIVRRKSIVVAKGKGEMETFWLVGRTKPEGQERGAYDLEEGPIDVAPLEGGGRQRTPAEGNDTLEKGA